MSSLVMRDKHVQACPCITVLLCVLCLWFSLRFYVVRRLVKYSHYNHTYIIKVRNWLEKVFMDGGCQSKQIRAAAASQGTGRHMRKFNDGQDYSRDLPSLQRQERNLKFAAHLMREQLTERMICSIVGDISDIHIHQTGYWNQRRAVWRHQDTKGKASRSIFQLLHLPIYRFSFCSLLCKSSVMSACVHWGLQLAHQTHSIQESTLPFQSPYLSFRQGSSKETGNL